MKILSIVSTAFFLACFVSLQAKDAAAPDLSKIKHPVKPMLWKIEGKGLKKPSYLFGSIHVADKRVTTLHPAAQKAFDQAGSFYAEIDLSPEKQVAATKYFIRKDNKSLLDILGAQGVAALDLELKQISPLFTSKVFDQFEIWAIGAMLPLLEEQLNGKKALDMQLWEKAKAAGKKRGALETYKKQLGIFEHLTQKDQVKLLMTSLKIMKKSRELKILSYTDIMNAYLLGDIQKIQAEFHRNNFHGIVGDKALNDRFLKLLLDGRNPGMSKSIIKAITAPNAGSCFFTAGTGHYIGKNSVVTHLKTAGYQITRIEN